MKFGDILCGFKTLIYDVIKIYVKNIPQVALQIWYLELVSDHDGIVYASMIFSILSLVITALSMISQRNIINSQHFVSIEFDIVGGITRENKQRCKNRVKIIQMEMATLMGLNETLLEVTRPSPTKKGLKVHINIYINHVKSIDMNIEQDINAAQNRGEIGEIIKTAWELSLNPEISNIKYKKHESKEMRDNMVFIGMMNTISKMNHPNQHSVHSEIAMGRIDVDGDMENTEESNEDLYDQDHDEFEGMDEKNTELPPLIPPVAMIQSAEDFGEKSHDSGAGFRENEQETSYIQ